MGGGPAGGRETPVLTFLVAFPLTRQRLNETTPGSSCAALEMGRLWSLMSWKERRFGGCGGKQWEVAWTSSQALRLLLWRASPDCSHADFGCFKRHPTEHVPLSLSNSYLGFFVLQAFLCLFFTWALSQALSYVCCQLSSKTDSRQAFAPTPLALQS